MMGNAQADFSGQRNSNRHYWRDQRVYRGVAGNQSAADHYFMRALCFAVPMATLIWVAAVMLLRTFL